MAIWQKHLQNLQKSTIKASHSIVLPDMANVPNVMVDKLVL